MADGLVLRDVHLPPTPPWWPPAPGWWMLIGALLVTAIVVMMFRARRARRRARIHQVFDAAVDAAGSPAERIAACSELLRRAARRRHPDADRLQGEDWLAFLDSPRVRFSDTDGRRLLDGPFRADVGQAEADAVVRLARMRFAELMGAP